MSRLVKCLLAVSLTFLVLAAAVAVAKPSFFKEKNTGSDLSELDAMLSGDHGDANSSREVYQLYGGQVRPIQTNITTGASYDVPYQDYFRDSAIFGDFLALFDGNITSPQINSSLRKAYLDSIAAAAPTAKGRMTDSGKQHHLKPLLIEMPQF